MRMIGHENSVQGKKFTTNNRLTLNGFTCFKIDPNLSPNANKSLGFILRSQLNPEEAASLRFRSDHPI